jgi:hypothetical protein
MSVGMKPSKKYAIGSVHENGTGRFEIKDRFLENNVIMLKYEWLTGEFAGKIDTNKESNINASIWKFKNVRGLLPSQQQEASVVEEKLDEVLAQLEQREEYIKAFQQEFQAQRDMITVLQGQLSEMQKIGLQNQEIIKKIASDNQIVQKLIDKM